MRNRSWQKAVLLGSITCLATISGCRKEEAQTPPDSSSKPGEAAPAGTAEVADSAAEPTEAPSASPSSAPLPAAPKAVDSSPGPRKVPGEGADASPASGTTLESVEKELLARWDEVETLSAKVTNEAKPQAGGADVRIEGGGTYHCRKKDGRLMVRLDLTNATIREQQGREMRDERRVLTVSDGESMWVLTESTGQAVARKLEPTGEHVIELGGRVFFERLHRTHDLRRLPDETLDGRTVYVIEGTSKQGAGRCVHYFDRETGVMVRIDTDNLAGTSPSTITLSDIKINQEISEDLFVFTPPKDARIIDRISPAEP